MNTNHHVKMIEYTEKYDFWDEQDNEVCVLDCADTLNGEYVFEDNGNEYVVIIEEK